MQQWLWLNLRQRVVLRGHPWRELAGSNLLFSEATATFCFSACYCYQHQTQRDITWCGRKSVLPFAWVYNAWTKGRASVLNMQPHADYIIYLFVLVFACINAWNFGSWLLLFLYWNRAINNYSEYIFYLSLGFILSKKLKTYKIFQFMPYIHTYFDAEQLLTKCQCIWSHHFLSCCFHLFALIFFILIQYW